MKRIIYLGGIIFFCIFLFSCKDKSPVYQLEKVAESSYQWTGIAISKDNRMFVNYPTWSIPAPFKVAEIVDGKEIAYPNDSVNGLFTCVQSVVVDDMNRLWILDPANPQFKGVVDSGAKLFMVDLLTNTITKTYNFPSDVAPKNSYLNDVRIDTKKEFAYITDSELGGIVVLDLNSGKSWRALDESCSAVKANLDGIDFVSTGKWTNIVNSDGIELSKDGNKLYFTALSGNVLYQISTSVLVDTTLMSNDRCSKVSILNKSNVPTDGMWLKNSTLYMADLPNEGLFEVDVKTGVGKQMFIGQKVRWADSFAEDNQGNLYFTTSQINYPKEQQVKFEIYKVKL